MRFYVTDDDSRVKVKGGVTDFINASYIDVNILNLPLLFILNL